MQFALHVKLPHLCPGNLLTWQFICSSVSEHSFDEFDEGDTNSCHDRSNEITESDLDILRVSSVNEWHQRL